MKKSYNELIRLKTFDERFHYLKMTGAFGRRSLTFDKYLSTALYHTNAWKRIREQVLIRDNGCDLGIEDREIFARATIHHINPITLDDVDNERSVIFDLNNLITASQETHNAIHYANESMLVRLPQERRKGDTIPWLTLT